MKLVFFLSGDVPKTSSKLILATQEMVLENLLKREMIELTAQRSVALQEKVIEKSLSYFPKWI